MDWLYENVPFTDNWVAADQCRSKINLFDNSTGAQGTTTLVSIPVWVSSYASIEAISLWSTWDTVAVVVVFLDEYSKVSTLLADVIVQHTPNTSFSVPLSEPLSGLGKLEVGMYNAGSSTGSGGIGQQARKQRFADLYAYVAFGTPQCLTWFGALEPCSPMISFNVSCPDPNTTPADPFAASQAVSGPATPLSPIAPPTPPAPPVPPSPRPPPRPTPPPPKSPSPRPPPPGPPSPPRPPTSPPPPPVPSPPKPPPPPVPATLQAWQTSPTYMITLRCTYGPGSGRTRSSCFDINAMVNGVSAQDTLRSKIASLYTGTAMQMYVDMNSTVVDNSGIAGVFPYITTVITYRAVCTFKTSSSSTSCWLPGQVINCSVKPTKLAHESFKPIFTRLYLSTRSTDLFCHSACRL